MTIDRPTFKLTRIGSAYSPAEVDAAVGLILDNLALPNSRIDPAAVAGLRFTPVSLQRGYASADVDAWLGRVVAELRFRSTREAVPDTAPAPAQTPPASRPAPEPAWPARGSLAPRPAYEPTRSDAIVEVGGSTPWALIGLLVLMVLGGIAIYAVR